uniref:Uncharacterized protein n=1 Tax=Anguilla anguilla TaxID=7936 RepID=A0A0E9S4P2_ANGAN
MKKKHSIGSLALARHFDVQKRPEPQ